MPPTKRHNDEKRESNAKTSEESFEKIVEKVVHKIFSDYEERQKAMFKTHEETVLTIISSNMKIFSDKFDKFHRDVEDLKQSVTFTDIDLNKKIKKQELQISSQYNEFNATFHSFKEKLVDLENRSRRNNLRITGLTEMENETSKDCEQIVSKLFTEKLGVPGVVVERAHRTGSTNSTTKPRTIILKLLNYQDKMKILYNCKKLKNTGVYVNEDFARETMDKRRELWEEVQRLRQEGKYAVLRFDKIVWRDSK